ncbi:hypothetical protein ANCDUO_00131 [Ancylostoma duodenale]|uniref:Uncharacterized protein n=1 Tax=Ancylostoma duodenale TaxID=51022 RepID=A0A0C2H6M6_9BILA|nr:hypothetical protein ANCDUO_00131 [Ancylostoma duodenale]
MSVSVLYRPWNVYERLFLYGLFGFAAEVCFTATWEAVEHGNRKLIGVTSMYIFFVYGLSILLLEKLYLNLKNSDDQFCSMLYGFVLEMRDKTLGVFIALQLG